MVSADIAKIARKATTFPRACNVRVMPAFPWDPPIRIFQLRYTSSVGKRLYANTLIVLGAGPSIALAEHRLPPPMARREHEQYEGEQQRTTRRYDGVSGR